MGEPPPPRPRRPTVGWEGVTVGGEDGPAAADPADGDGDRLGEAAGSASRPRRRPRMVTGS